MKAMVFESRIDRNGTITLPTDATDRIAAESPVQVIVLYPDGAETGEQREETAWRNRGYEAFLDDDAPEEAVYDRLYGDA